MQWIMNSHLWMRWLKGINFRIWNLQLVCIAMAFKVITQWHSILQCYIWECRNDSIQVIIDIHLFCIIFFYDASNSCIDGICIRCNCVGHSNRMVQCIIIKNFSCQYLIDYYVCSFRYISFQFQTVCFIRINICKKLLIVILQIGKRWNLFSIWKLGSIISLHIQHICIHYI